MNEPYSLPDLNRTVAQDRQTEAPRIWLLDTRKPNPCRKRDYWLVVRFGFYCFMLGAILTYFVMRGR